MSETNIEALERLCRENLDGLDFQVTMTTDRTRKTWGGSTEAVQASTEILVDYMGPPHDIETIVEEHGEAVIHRHEVQDFMGGERTTSADVVLTADPHDTWTGSGATGGRSGGSSSPATPGSSDSDDDSDDTSHGASGGVTGEGPHQPFPDPSGQYVENPDGEIHVVANWPEKTDGGPFVCDAAPAKNDSRKIRDDYDSLIEFCADWDVCEWCAKAMMGYYNIPEEKVLAAEESNDG